MPSAMNWPVWPGNATESVLGVMESPVIGSVEVLVQIVHAVTVKVTSLLTISSPPNPGMLAEMVVFPIHAMPVVGLKPVAVATPELLMVATWGALEDQVT
jgi:hypothetical protein